jgi:hypothetical protein
VANGYLLISGETGDYYQMADEIQSNPYFKEALSYVDDELLKYQGDEQLTWWAQAIVGLFGDFVDVENLSATIDNLNFYTTAYFCDNSENSCQVRWQCGIYLYKTNLKPNSFLVVSSVSPCITTFFTPSYCYFFVCWGLEGYEFETCMDCCSSDSSSDPVGWCVVTGGGGPSCLSYCEWQKKHNQLNCPPFSGGLDRCLAWVQMAYNECIGQCNSF